MPTLEEIQAAEVNYNLAHTPAEKADLLSKVKLLPPYEDGKTGVQVHQLRAFYTKKSFASLVGMLEALVSDGALTKSSVPSPNKKVRFDVYTVTGGKS